VQQGIRAKGIDVSHGVCRMLMWVGLVAGFASIVASVAIWFAFKTDDRAHAERFGIFVGLWAPTFFVLANWVGIRGAQMAPVQIHTTPR
jgi:hypothetical protein